MVKIFKQSIIHIFMGLSAFYILNSCSSASEPDTEPPTLVITNPANNVVLYSSIRIKADASDNDGIKKVQFLIDGEILGEDISAPFEQNWNVSFWADGNTHTILAKAEDKSGNKGQSGIINVKVSEDAMSLVNLIYPKNETLRNSNSIEFVWEKLVDAISYQIDVAVDQNFDSILFTNNTLDTTVTINGLPEGLYFWRVKGQNNHNIWTDWSIPSQVIIDGPLPPILIVPSNLWTFDSIQTIDFVWKSSMYSHNYKFELSTDISFLNPDYSAIVSDTSLSVPGLSNGKYYWRVKGQNFIDIWGDWSAISMFTISQLGPVAIFSFNGNADDESGNANHGTVNGAMLTEDRFGSSNSAYAFDGNNDYIDISHIELNPNVLFQSSFSIEAWIKLNSITGTQTIISFGYDTGDPMLFEIHEGRMRLHMEIEGGDYKPANTTLNINTWYHVKIVGILGEGITFYLNDIEDGDENRWGSMSGTKSAIGAGYGGSPGRFFKGIIDDIVIKKLK